jgi:hypothetical protein
MWWFGRGGCGGVVEGVMGEISPAFTTGEVLRISSRLGVMGEIWPAFVKLITKDAQDIVFSGYTAGPVIQKPDIQ